MTCNNSEVSQFAQGRSKHILSGQARKWVWLWMCSGNNALNLQHLIITLNSLLV